MRAERGGESTFIQLVYSFIYILVISLIILEYKSLNFLQDLSLNPFLLYVIFRRRKKDRKEKALQGQEEGYNQQSGNKHPAGQGIALIFHYTFFPILR